ncbi:MAG: hypothetical protein GTO42_08525 [Candidatus Latescibacteria bacterium]|nr:hypothetical protein [Candidatus Latescibacterota bacterium]NIO29003.1 hypothetical protein [Candidatus Latescibacterota bacterium]NIO56628.1 hypothetical protein [Candidatus Latescibacterota bacterium]NIT02212.1 hypothetical protein [Candidatus Latescibacterota bacterium]NIT39097.1 hypothetical protein [Candidatus Latescibacterota bacterium]
MRKARILASFLVYLIIAVNMHSSAIKAADKYKLQYKMDKGMKFDMKISLKHRNQRNIMGNELITNSVDMIEYGFDVVSAGVDGLELELEYKGRARDTDDSMSRVGTDFSPLIGKKVRMFLSSKGELSGFEKFEHLPVIEIPDQQSSLTKDHYIIEIKNIFPELPDGHIGLGESWSYSRQYDAPVQEGNVTVRLHVTYTLLEETRRNGHDCLKIAGKYAIDIAGGLIAGGMDLALTLKGEGSEVVYFAWKKGMLLGIESTSVVEGAAENEELELSMPMRHEYQTALSVELD